MSLQTTVLLDGAWVTRRVDIGEILARNRESTLTSEKPKKTKPPATGVLTRTLIQGPVVQWVLPARLRHQDCHDVIFIGDKFIQIKELVPNGHLEEVVTKSDFDAKIIGAKVISTSFELALEDQMRLGVEGRSQDSMSETMAEPSLPPQILVLALSTQELLFMYTTGPRDLPQFVHTRRPLPADVSSLEEYGKHVAVDHRSRAMAISAAQKFFGIFSLKPSSIIRSEMRKGPVNPIQEERFFRAEGDILRMKFLYPTASDHDKIILLLLISKGSETHFVCYDWDASENLRSITPRPIGQKLRNNLRLPSVVIPLMNTTSFMLTTPSHIYVFKNVLEAGSSLTPKTYPIPPLEVTRPNTQIWTHWARPMRNWSRNQRFDDIYLCREDGKVLYLEIEKGGEFRQTRLGSLGCNIDEAFAIIPGGYEAGDLLVAAGSMNGGGLYVEDARKPPRCIQRIPNWGPILDTVLVKAANHYRGDGRNIEGRQVIEMPYDRIFACSGIGADHGSITELRHGLEARIGLLIEQEGASNIMGIWAFPSFATGGTYFLSTDPVSSSLILIPIDATEELYAIDEENTALNLNSQTLAAGCTPQGVIIQVTYESICLTVPGDENLQFSKRWEGFTERVISAAVNGTLSLFAVAIRTNEYFRVELRKAEVDTSGLRCSMIGEPLAVPYEPISFAIEKLGDRLILVIGTGDGKLLVADVNDKSGLTPLFEREIALLPDENSSPACECLRIVSTDKHGEPKTTLFCGLRGGNLISFNVHFTQENSALELEQAPPHKLGDTAVKIRGYESDNSCAIVACESGLWRLSHVKDDSIQYVLEKIWITDQNNPARMQPIVEVFNSVDTTPSARLGGLGGSLICIAENELFACTLENIPKAVPRQIPVPGNPKRLVYSEYLKTIIVGYNAAQCERINGNTERWIRPRIGFVDPNENSVVSATVDLGSELERKRSGLLEQSRQPTGASGEKIMTLLDWQFTCDNREYHMIVVGTTQPQARQHGRVVYIMARPNSRVPRKIDCTIKYVHNYDQAVRAIAPFKPSSLVLAVGDEIIIQTLNALSRKWKKMPGFKLESPPVSLTVKEPYIYVLTARHSLCILRASIDGLTLHGQAGADREGLDHLNLDEDSKMIMTANRGGAVIGLSEIGLTPQEKLIDPVFSAHLSSSVIRLNHSFRPSVPGSAEIAYGATINGTIYQFTTLKENEWRLLRFIQNICMGDQLICPFMRKRRIAIDELDPPNNKPEFMHVDGDILDRLTSRGSRYLEEIMRRSSSSEQDSRFTGDNNRKMERFIEFSTEVVGKVDNPFSTVMLWMQNLLRINI